MPRFNSREEYEQWKAGLREDNHSPPWDQPADRKPIEEPSWQSLSDGYSRAAGERPIRPRQTIPDDTGAEARRRVVRKSNLYAGLWPTLVGGFIVGLSAYNIHANTEAGFIWPWTWAVGLAGLAILGRGLGLVLLNVDFGGDGTSIVGKFGHPFWLVVAVCILIADTALMRAITPDNSEYEMMVAMPLPPVDQTHRVTFSRFEDGDWSPVVEMDLGDYKGLRRALNGAEMGEVWASLGRKHLELQVYDSGNRRYDVEVFSASWGSSVVIEGEVYDLRGFRAEKKLDKWRAKQMK